VIRACLTRTAVVATAPQMESHEGREHRLRAAVTEVTVGLVMAASLRQAILPPDWEAMPPVNMVWSG
jgi:hypothetical protein